MSDIHPTTAFRDGKGTEWRSEWVLVPKRSGKKPVDRTGQRYGHLTVDRPTLINGLTAWVCRCVCGNEKTVRTSNLSTTTSCGCKFSDNRKHASLRHGHNKGGSRTKEYRAWAHIIGRCHRPSDNGYYAYGAKGITVCDAWRNSFEAFLADMGPAPSPKHSIERSDNALGYCPSNCRWATAAEQSRNTSRNVIINGQILEDYCRERGLNPGTVGGRILRGDPVDIAISELTGHAYRALKKEREHV